MNFWESNQFQEPVLSSFCLSNVSVFYPDDVLLQSILPVAVQKKESYWTTTGNLLDRILQT